ncbi:MAG: response regulator [Nitrospirae bacterium]|nr:response regulator [Nitrospirota bacterium]
MVKKILIVDDQSAILYGMSKALNVSCAFKGEITIAETGKKAIDSINSNQYDICFLDLNLPDISGMEIMERIRMTSPKTKVVVMTAEYLDDDVMKKIAGNASLFIPKPIELDIVKAFVNHELSDEDFHHAEENDGTDFNNEKRKFPRSQYRRTVHYSIYVSYDSDLKTTLQGDIIDISLGGAGLRTGSPVFFGDLLRFDDVLGSKSGIVKWSVKENGDYRAGVQFI